MKRRNSRGPVAGGGVLFYFVLRTVASEMGDEKRGGVVWNGWNGWNGIDELEYRKMRDAMSNSLSRVLQRHDGHATSNAET